MNSFTYARPADVTAAVQDITANREAKFIAGGTNILDLMKENVMNPGHLTDISRLALKSVEENESGGLRLGALATNAATAYHPEVEKRYPLLSKAILAGASPQLRNMATDGGNLLQRTRCYYFYDLATPCNKRSPGSGCSAINGYNRIHAILGANEQCITTHPSDMCVALAALKATVLVTGENGDRAIPFAEFHRLPGDTPYIDNNLQPDEIITGIDLPEKGFAENHSYLKIRDRASYAFAIISVAAAMELEGDTVREVRIALGGVAHKPWRDEAAEQSLVGKPATKENFRQVANTIISGAKGYEHNTFKIELAKRAIVRALCQAAKIES